jgi:hypothetical protein
MEKVIKIKKEDLDFSIKKIKEITRVDIFDDYIEITFDIK